jgi:hypothetical protein
MPPNGRLPSYQEIAFADFGALGAVEIAFTAMAVA